MKHFRKVWDGERKAFLASTKGMGRKAALALFRERYPHLSDVTDTAFYNQRSREGAAGTFHGGRNSRKPRPLWSEQEKKGYVRIKIAQPGVWVSKSKWVYMETHPWEDFSERSNYIFLDGDSRNFRAENIERVPLRLMGIFNNLGGCVRGRADLTRLNLLRARLLSARLDAGERMGLTVEQGNCRKFREERNLRMREYNSDPERRKKINERAREYYRRLKSENPHKYEEQQKRHKEYAKQWNERRKNDKN